MKMKTPIVILTPMPSSQAYTLHAYASPSPGSVNSYWLETPLGIVLIDAQRQLSFAGQPCPVPCPGKQRVFAQGIPLST